MLLNLLPKYLNIKLRASPGCDSSSFSGWFCLLVWPSFLSERFRLFAWFVNVTSLLLSEDDGCGIDSVDTYLLLNWLKQLNFSKRDSWFINCFSEDHFDDIYVDFLIWYEITTSILINLWRFQTEQRLIYLGQVTEYVIAYVSGGSQ